MEERTVTLNVDWTKIYVDWTKISGLTPYDELYRAIGRLSMWSLESFPKCIISNDGLTDLVAVYLNEEDRKRFVIGAIWRDKEKQYTFHS